MDLELIESLKKDIVINFGVRPHNQAFSYISVMGPLKNTIVTASLVLLFEENTSFKIIKCRYGYYHSPQTKQMWEIFPSMRFIEHKRIIYFSEEDFTLLKMFWDT